MRKLTAEAARELARHCALVDIEPRSEGVRVEGALKTFDFHAGRLAERDADISAFLAELPAPFHAGQGGSMNEAGVDRHGRQWTGLTTTIDELFCMGVAAGKLSWTVPKEQWAEMPDGLPTAVVK